MLHKLIWDGTDATTRGASAQVGAVLYDAVNDRLGLINASQELLVKDTDVASALAGTITVDALNLDIRDLTAASDSVESWTHDGTGTAITSTGGALDVNLSSGSITFPDSYAEDSVHSSGDTGTHIMGVRQDTLASSVSADGDYGSLKLDSIGALYTNISNEPSVNLQAGDGTDITETGGALDVNVTNSIDLDDDLADTAIQVVAETVAATLGVIIDGADELASRKHVWLYNNSNKGIYIGPTGTTVTDGFPIPPGAILHARIGSAVDLYAIGDGAGLNMRTMQAS